MKQVCLAVLLSLLVSACAIGVQHQYAEIVPSAPVAGSASTAVGVLDKRPYVVSGNKAANFVGLSRGGFGNPFDVTTESNNALVDDFRDAVIAALKKDGVLAIPVSLAPVLTAPQAAQTLREQNQERSILITLIEWKADTYANTALLYDVNLKVLDRRGVPVAEKAIAGKDDLGSGGGLNPPAHSRAVIPEAFRRKLEELLGDAKVLAALRK